MGTTLNERIGRVRESNIPAARPRRGRSKKTARQMKMHPTSTKSAMTKRKTRTKTSNRKSGIPTTKAAFVKMTCGSLTRLCRPLSAEWRTMLTKQRALATEDMVGAGEREKATRRQNAALKEIWPTEAEMWQ